MILIDLFCQKYMINRQMRLLVFFDLPTTTDKEKKAYNEFRKFLINNGFKMLQYSVYVRLTRNYDDLKKYVKRLNNNLPSKGTIHTLELTEMQYARMNVLVGKVNDKLECDETAELIEI